MTCSACGATRHNKRYHDRPDADWFQNCVETTIPDGCNQNNMINETQTSKLYPRRSKNIMGLNNMINEPQPSNFQFMPTLGIDLAEHAGSVVPSPILEVITKTMGLNNMIKDLEQMQQQEDARMRKKAKQLRMDISSHHIVSPRTTNHNATQ
ncbi:Uncharacterized protein Adt_38069 [Abeliophyllum distichum]|uniref:Uncharacterized protein n=1 Tax=Abeliophyllum distichum TaxID=126358 RepID=A0ABD1Q179_9LAMI